MPCESERPYVELWLDGAVQPFVIARLDSFEDTTRFVETIRAASGIQRIITKNPAGKILETWERE